MKKSAENYQNIIRFAIISAIVALAIMLFGGLSSYNSLRGQQMDKAMERGELAIATSNNKKVSFSVEIARSGEDLAHGLMFREHLKNDAGMLFIFPHVDEAQMWMRNTKIPLDMLFIDANGRIVKIAENARPYDERVISSLEPVRGALEINGGLAAAMGIKVGDQVLGSYFNPALSQ